VINGPEVEIRRGCSRLLTLYDYQKTLNFSHWVKIPNLRKPRVRDFGFFVFFVFVFFPAGQSLNPGHRGVKSHTDDALTCLSAVVVD